MSAAVRPVRPSPYPPIRKPYTPPKPSERGKPKMTVAMGIKCMEGVVLCADTEITLPNGGKGYEDKVFKIRKDFGCYMAYCGHVPFAKEVVAHVRSLASAASSPDECLALANQGYATLLERESRKKKSELQYFAEFLISIRRHDPESGEYETSLYHMYGANRIYPIEQFAVIGIGDEMTKALCDGRAFPINLIGSTFVGVDTIRRIKRSVGGCGGETTVVEIPNSDEEPFSAYGSEAIAQIEADYDYLDKELNLLRIIFPGKMKDVEFDGVVRLLCKKLNERRHLPDRVNFSSSL